MNADINPQSIESKSLYSKNCKTSTVKFSSVFGSELSSKNVQKHLEGTDVWCHHCGYESGLNVMQENLVLRTSMLPLNADTPRSNESK